MLTLRGGGSVTPLMVKGWSLEDLETVMREATEGTAGPDADARPVPAVAEAPLARKWRHHGKRKGGRKRRRGPKHRHLR